MLRWSLWFDTHLLPLRELCFHPPAQAAQLKDLGISSHDTMDGQ